MKTKDIKIRNVDEKIIKKIDWLASQKNQSREEYLRMLLRRLTEASFLVDRGASYIEVMLLLEGKLAEYTELLQAITEDLND